MMPEMGKNRAEQSQWCFLDPRGPINKQHITILSPEITVSMSNERALIAQNKLSKSSLTTLLPESSDWTGRVAPVEGHLVT